MQIIPGGLSILPLLAAAAAPAAALPWTGWSPQDFALWEGQGGPANSLPSASASSSSSVAVAAAFAQTLSTGSASAAAVATSSGSSVSGSATNAAVAATPSGSSSGSSGSSSSGKLVFAHYMLITRPPSGDYSTDMQAAKALGVDAFAVNYGGVNTNYAQQNAWLTEFYGKAQANGMKAFLSIDTTITPTITPAQIANLTQTFASHPAQLQVDGKPLLTSFELGPPTAWNWKTDVLEKVNPTPLFVGCSLSASGANTLTVDQSQGSAGSVTWLQPTLSAEEQVALDQQTSQAKGNNLWIATVAPWFFKRLSASQNWAQAQDDAILVDRLAHLLSLSPAPDFIELTTWNDWGEGTYFGPADVNDDCQACYYSKLNHTAFGQLAKPYLTAFKNGAKAPAPVAAADEEVFMFYRTQRAAVNDNSGLPLPENVTSEHDNVYVVGLLAQPAEVTVTTGPTTTTVSLAAGVQKTAIPFGLGAQGLVASRNGQQVGAKKSGPAINGTVTLVNDNAVII